MTSVVLVRISLLWLYNRISETQYIEKTSTKQPFVPLMIRDICYGWVHLIRIGKSLDLFRAFCSSGIEQNVWKKNSMFIVFKAAIYWCNKNSDKVIHKNFITLYWTSIYDIYVRNLSFWINPSNFLKIVSDFLLEGDWTFQLISAESPAEEPWSHISLYQASKWSLSLRY